VFVSFANGQFSFVLCIVVKQVVRQGYRCDRPRQMGYHRTYAQDLNGWREAEGMSRLGPLEIL